MGPVAIATQRAPETSLPPDGWFLLIGLAAKNAILIVEFAMKRREEGASITEAALDAARLRLRPILMTSIAFIAGVFPLVVSTGAGAEMRRAMGTAVFSGMIGVTLLGLFLTPVFYVLMMKLGKQKKVEPARTSRSERRVEWLWSRVRMAWRVVDVAGCMVRDGRHSVNARSSFSWQ